MDAGTCNCPTGRRARRALARAQVRMATEASTYETLTKRLDGLAARAVSEFRPVVDSGGRCLSRFAPVFTHAETDEVGRRPVELISKVGDGE